MTNNSQTAAESKAVQDTVTQTVQLLGKGDEGTGGGWGRGGGLKLGLYISRVF